MSDRRPGATNTRPLRNTLTVPGPSASPITTTTSITATASSVRRNLFQSHLGRRPPNSVPSTASTATTGIVPPPRGSSRLSGAADLFIPDDDAATATHPCHPCQPISSSTSSLSSCDIVVRDKNGDFVEVGDPESALGLQGVSAVVGQGRRRTGDDDGGMDLGEDEDNDDGGWAGMGDETGAEAAYELGRKMHLNKARLAEALLQYRMGADTGLQVEGLLEDVQNSLREKVAALAEDNWMYEREELSRHL